jgi:hypothetical protein
MTLPICPRSSPRSIQHSLRQVQRRSLHTCQPFCRLLPPQNILQTCQHKALHSLHPIHPRIIRHSLQQEQKSSAPTRQLGIQHMTRRTCRHICQRITLPIRPPTSRLMTLRMCRPIGQHTTQVIRQLMLQHMTQHTSLLSSLLSIQRWPRQAQRRSPQICQPFCQH